ncbi:cytochrome b561 domain-containing protein [Jannaschia sp. S6380]|uniref:cytochrome b561 domain-containing protein n=1 Tax=Jannaschia sp. S6380 TaxID=2926408 RepID=UPI001FF58883|nr:cytochrome b561 domain-containing protein [Jannaschia sp. S6380]MCK0168044.1 cytochrome b561 domain-containing protein [Jannaschia sp. S6380]
MLDWLLTPIDATRPHDLGLHLKYHGRLMVIAWGFLVPAGVIAARFFKVLPNQRFPEEVGNLVWWRSHLVAQIGALLLMLGGLYLVLTRPETTDSLTVGIWIHRAFGWAVLWLGLTQALSGAFRGSKGGPTDRRNMRGDHYDMTPRRLAFEILHKAAGYAALGLSMGAVLSGMWQANAPIWMWIVLPAWWAMLAVLFVLFQRRGMVIDTYVALWGPDAIHPGNARRGPPQAGE